MDKFEVEPISASWDEGGNVILEVSITLPQQTISKPEALRICELINHALSLDPPEASRILPRGFACVLGENRNLGSLRKVLRTRNT